MPSMLGCWRCGPVFATFSGGASSRPSGRAYAGTAPVAVGHPRPHRPRGPTVGEVADYLLLRHHSVVGLIDRADEAGLVATVPGCQQITVSSDCILLMRELSGWKASRLNTSRSWSDSPPNSLGKAWAQSRPHTASRAAPANRRVRNVEVARVYEAPEPGPAVRVLVDRLWPRGISRSEASFDKWMKSVAPSSDLRKWYGHRADRFAEFSDRYRASLLSRPPSEDVRRVAPSGRGHRPSPPYRHQGLSALPCHRAE